MDVTGDRVRECGDVGRGVGRHTIMVTCTGTSSLARKRTGG